MPVVLQHYTAGEKFAVFCAKSSCHLLQGQARHIVLFFAGCFTLEEVNRFVIDALDEGLVPPVAEDYFTNPVWCDTTAWTAAPGHGQIAVLQYVIEMFSVLEFTDSYTFHIIKHFAHLALTASSQAQPDSQPTLS